MKRLFLLFALLGSLCVTFSASAQSYEDTPDPYEPRHRYRSYHQGEFRFGARAAYYIGANAFGAGVYANYALTNWLNIEPGVNVICKAHSSIDIYCDFQIPLEVARDWSIYPIVGLSANEIGSKSRDAYGWSCGLNLGAGTSFECNRRWLLSGSLKWMAQSAKNHPNPIIFSVGAAYRF